MHDWKTTHCIHDASLNQVRGAFTVLTQVEAPGNRFHMHVFFYLLRLPHGPRHATVCGLHLAVLPVFTKEWMPEASSDDNATRQRIMNYRYTVNISYR